MAKPTLTVQLMHAQKALNESNATLQAEREAFAATLAALETKLDIERDKIAAAQPAATKIVATRKIRATITCPKCNGTGIYGDDGDMCYACAGTGKQDDAQQRRNWGYAQYRRTMDASMHPVHSNVAPKQHKPTAQAVARADAIKAYFAANPGARSVSPAQLEEFSHAPA